MKTSSSTWKQFAKNAPLFAALGDDTRLSLLLQLGEANLASITQLSEGRPQTRQAIRKHLQILEDACLVKGVRRGRENLFQVNPKTMAAASQSLAAISRQWDDALARLKSFVEE
ncbi:ArsR/SmtB family transcription factor [Pirellula sp. SH-Sr6A]|uniref:ArsR/SmtB family transcription factor n=1 Tax=Pirellula sp. SH-Sr6A TaxID=1632865 RepID=UPI00197C134F|nr:helix-turn-helix domain-containing protein [Pirellula sp. SH-Sr6A]